MAKLTVACLVIFVWIDWKIVILSGGVIFSDFSGQLYSNFTEYE